MKRKTLSLIIFLATLIAITIPSGMLIGAQTDNFTSNVTVGNNAPVIDWVNDSVQQAPQEGGTKIIQIQMNVTDTNGVDDINTSDCFMNITRPGETTRTSPVCYSTGNASNTQEIECNITIYWYDEPGEWVITAYAVDSPGSSDTNNTSNFTMDNADFVDVIETALTFSGSPGDTNQAEEDNPLVINNTGNQNYTEINITAYDLIGAVLSDVIGAGNFTVNVSNSGGAGQTLVNNSDVLITDAALDRGASATEDLFFWVGIPNGIQEDEYTSALSWQIDPTV